MSRFCYCSKILPGKSDVIRAHWKNKPIRSPETARAEESFWDHMKMTGFEAWLQPTPKGDFLIHCLEGESLQGIFKGLREQIVSKNPVALTLQSYYRDVLGKDYSMRDIEPSIEALLDVSLPCSSPIVKKGFMYPILPEKVEAHKKFRNDSNRDRRTRHEASMRAFGVSRLTQWLQTTPTGTYCVVYTERLPNSEPSAEKRLEQGKNSPEWQEIAAILMDHTGLSYNELSPQVEWLTA